MYDKIQHPKTGKWHKTDSSIGSKLIKGYAKKVNQTGGGFESRLNQLLVIFNGILRNYRSKTVHDKFIMSQMDFNMIRQNFDDAERTYANLLSTDQVMNPSHYHNARREHLWSHDIKKNISDINAVMSTLRKMKPYTVIRDDRAAPATFSPPELNLFPELVGVEGPGADAARQGLGVWGEIAELRRRARDDRAKLAVNLQQQQQQQHQRAALQKARIDQLDAELGLKRAQPVPLGEREGGLFRVPFAVANERQAVADAYAEINRKQQEQARGGLFGPPPVEPAFGPRGAGDGANDPIYKRAFNQYQANRARGKPGPAPFRGFG